MRRLFAAGLLLVVVLLLSAQAGATKPQPHTTRARAAVWTLALGGPRVAYASAGRIYVWNVVTGRTSVIGGGYSNAAHAVNAAELAIAGTRIAWVSRRQLGNTELPTRLYTARLGGSAHRLRKVLGYTDVGCGGATVALSGNRLVVLSETSSKPAFEVYDWKTGALVNSRPVAQRPLDFAVAGRLVAYSRAQLHLLDLATGKDVVLASQPGILYRGLAMDARGLVYVVNRWKSSPFAESSGKLVFVPRTVLLAKVGQ